MAESGLKFVSGGILSNFFLMTWGRGQLATPLIVFQIVTVIMNPQTVGGLRKNNNKEIGVIVEWFALMGWFGRWGT